MNPVQKLTEKMATQGYQPNDHHLHHQMHHIGGYDQWNQGQSYYDPNHMAYAQVRKK